MSRKAANFKSDGERNTENKLKGWRNMKRKFLANMGLSKAQIDTILDENSQNIRKTKAELASVQTELNLLKINAAVENALFMLKAAEQEIQKIAQKLSESNLWKN